MLISFKEIDHPIYVFHEHITYIFNKIFAYDLPFFDEEKLVHADFIPILNSAQASVLSPLKDIVRTYHSLPYGDKITLQIALNNNNTTEIFDNDKIQLIKYDEINPKISGKLKSFFENLWNDYPQVVAMERTWGTVKDHYDKLVDELNCDFLVCPFCGIETFEPANGKYREAYDHIIAKAKYPFASVNFKLLFPCCNKCNSNEKRATDTLYDDLGNRRISYYPYDQNLNLDNLSISINILEPYNADNLETLLRSIRWQFTILRDGQSNPRIESWNMIYGIERRFKERIGRLEKQWYGELVRLFKISIRDGKEFSVFIKDTMDSLKYQIPIVGMGIIKYIYISFIFSISTIEEQLKKMISNS